MAASEKPVVTFTIWLMGNKQSGRRTLMAGLLHHLRKRVGVDSNDIIVRHVVANIQDGPSIPPTTDLIKLHTTTLRCLRFLIVEF